MPAAMDGVCRKIDNCHGSWYTQKMDNYQFPRQKVLCDDELYTRELLHDLLQTVYAASPPFTGYLKIAVLQGPLLFLYFLDGAPYAAGRHADTRPLCYSLQDLGEYLVQTAAVPMSVTLCETDPILLKSMLLFMQEVPAIKAPTSLVDIDQIVQQIHATGVDALIALCREKAVNLFFFGAGNEASAYFADLDFERHDGMTVDEEMQLYAFQPGAQVEVAVYRDLGPLQSREAGYQDMDSLFKLLTEGRPKNRRREDRERSSAPAKADGAGTGIFPLPAPSLPDYVLSFESGPLKGGRFAVTFPCTIGRGDCDLILDDRLVSRQHAVIRVDDNQLVIEDLASTNGTRVNGVTITRKQLLPNDVISIGPTNLRIHLAE
jgi:hypothetical protein